MKPFVSKTERCRSPKQAGRIGTVLPTLTLVLMGVWLGRNAVAALGGDSGNSDPRVCLTHVDPAERTQCLESTAVERRIRKVTWQTVRGASAPNRTYSISDESVLVESTRPVRIELGSADYWAAHPDLWRTNAVKVGDLVYPRESLVAQILRGSGKDPALALAKELAVYRIASATSPEAFVSAESGLRETAADRADALLAANPPGSVVGETVVREMQQLQSRFAAWNRSDEVLAGLR